VVEDRDELHRASADALHTLTPATSRQAAPPDPDVVQAAENWVRVNVQMPRSSAERAARLEQADVRRAYLEEAMAVQRRRLQDRWSEYDAKVAKGEESYRLLRDTALTGSRSSSTGRRRSWTASPGSASSAPAKSPAWGLPASSRRHRPKSRTTRSGGPAKRSRTQPWPSPCNSSARMAGLQPTCPRRCPNPVLAEHRVDLVRQTWLGKKKGRMVALKPLLVPLRVEGVRAAA
jgi:hypothetical protein